MSAWQPIETLPESMKDGRPVMVKRVYKGQLVKEGLAVFAEPHEDAPICRPIDPDPLGRGGEEAVDAIRTELLHRRWRNPDRMYAFPDPTHWRQD